MIIYLLALACGNCRKVLGCELSDGINTLGLSGI